MFEPLFNHPKAGSTLELDPVGTWKLKSFHLFKEEDLLAIDAARAAKRPLLVQGEPGTGKSQLARAAAYLLEAKLIAKVIDANTEIEDLWFRYDSVKRLAQAQLLGARQATETEALDSLLKPEKFIVPGVMWQTFDWKDAQEQMQRYQNESVQPVESEEVKCTVLLIDEIDKAGSDLPNSLLEVLANQAFSIDLLNKTIGAQDNAAQCELVVITSNDERPLPPAFLRRCVILKLALPKNEDEFVNTLVERGKQHHKIGESHVFKNETVLIMAAQQLFEDRQRAEEQGLPKPGQAEYLDMLRVLEKHNLSPSEQEALLERIRPFIFRKHESLDMLNN